MIRVPIRPPSRITLAADLTLPTIELPEWTRDGLCAQIGGHAWDGLGVDKQVQFCQPCPVIEVCAAFGVEQIQYRQKTGTTVYGGLTPSEIADRASARRAERVA